MKIQIDNKKMWESIMSREQEYHNAPINKSHIQEALRDQGLEWNGKEIVNLEPKLDKYYVCIKSWHDAIVDFDINQIYASDGKGNFQDNSGEVTLLGDIDIHFRPATDDEVKEYIEETYTKFKVGDWIVDYQGCEPMQIEKLGRYRYYLTNGMELLYLNEGRYRLWTIKDVKDGDILATLDYIIIFKGHLKNDGGVSYCHYDFGAQNPQFNYNEDRNWYFGKEAVVSPATKEQRELLFAKMKEAGYSWDPEKKELSKIITNRFKVGDKIVEDNEFGMVGGEIIDISSTHYELDSGMYVPITDEKYFKLVEITEKGGQIKFEGYFGKLLRSYASLMGVPVVEQDVDAEKDFEAKHTEFLFSLARKQIAEELEANIDVMCKGKGTNYRGGVEDVIKRVRKSNG